MNTNIRRTVAAIAMAGLAALTLAVPSPASADSDIESTWSVTQWCAHSVSIVREVPGTGRPMVWGKRMQAGKRVVADEGFAHEVGTAGDTSCQTFGSSTFASVGNYVAVNALVWGRESGLHGKRLAPKGTRPGVYRYTATATAVACELTEGTVIARCTATPTVWATSVYTVKVKRNRGLVWNADDDWGNRTLPQW